jgi:hypothetical protein
LADPAATPVPPLINATTPVTFAEFPKIFPTIWEPGRLNADSVVSVELLVAVMLDAVPVMFPLGIT